MVKCSNCGLEIDDNFQNCPNCGNDLSKSDVEVKKEEISTCNSCGAPLKDSDSFCASCGSKVEIENSALRCKNCGSELPQNAVFCQVCGAKVEKIEQTSKRTCPNCGGEVDGNTTFCQECGANVFTGEKNKHKAPASNSSAGKIDFNVLVKPSIIALIVGIILSIIGLAIGFSWYSFVIAVILSAGFFAAAVGNQINAIVFGFIVGLILGLLETPLIEFLFGSLVAGIYQGFFGGHLLIIINFGIVSAYVSNAYFKESILKRTDNFKGKL